jgi:uncharacterized protein
MVEEFEKGRIDPFVFFPRRPIMVSAFDGKYKKMKNPPIKTALFFLLLSPFLLKNLHAAAPPPDAPSKYVMDNASVLKANTANRLSGQLADLDHRTADELIIVIYANLQKGVSIGEYARQLYDRWNIGKRGGKDTGALLLICTQERQGRIHAGRGLATKLPEDVCRKIFIETIAPRLDAGDYDGACTVAVNALIAAVSR